MTQTNSFLITGVAALLLSCTSGSATRNLPDTVTIPKATLKDKIKGGWAGQTIGVTYGGPTEFKYNGTFIQDYQPIVWYDGYLKETMEGQPGLYDDIYMDLTFVEVFERLGLDAPVDSFAHAFAHAEYSLWHANQAARYNILQGMKAPESGHWLNNPHADDIDYQIEADFAGLMSPGMPNAASEISDKIGHIMNYGDGWYGGVYVGAMYALAFVSDDIQFIVREALKTIPKESKYYRCMADVIRWYEQYPDDWKSTWFEIQKHWSEDIGCPKGTFHAYNIDATTNSAYVLLGLLYGNGDFGKTTEIATRAGQDSDCNPATAAGILGTMIGYSNIPDYWRMGLTAIEDMDFKYTGTSLNRVYDMGYGHALEMIERHGGTVSDTEVQIKVQEPKAVRLEQSFTAMHPTEKTAWHKPLTPGEHTLEFEGTGIVIGGLATKLDPGLPDIVLDATISINGGQAEAVKLPTDFVTRKLELFWKYQLPRQRHRVSIVVGDVPAGYRLTSPEYVVYSDHPAVN